MGLHRILLAALVATASASMNVTFCSDAQCEETPLETIQLTGASGCRTDNVWKTMAVKISSSQDMDTPQHAVRFYRSTDCFGHCGSGHLISTFTDGFQRMSPGYNGAASPMQSWEVVEVDGDGHYAPHGYCGVRHGDAQYFRGRTWKWQQIGYQSFREVPIEDWDDALYPKTTGHDYDMHGSVDSSGTTKMRQIAESSWIGVDLEDWDDEVHVRITEPLVYHDAFAAEDEQGRHDDGGSS